MVIGIVWNDTVLMKNFENVVEDGVSETMSHFDVGQDDQKTQLKFAVMVDKLDQDFGPLDQLKLVDYQYTTDRVFHDGLTDELMEYVVQELAVVDERRELGLPLVALTADEETRRSH